MTGVTASDRGLRGGAGLHPHDPGPGPPSAAAAFTLTPVDDTVAEPPETVTVGSSTAGVVVIPATVTITDDDDVTAPALTGATVEGALLALTYDETLDGDSVPAPGAFTVRVARPAPEPPSPADLLDVEGPQTGPGVVTGEDTQAVDRHGGRGPDKSRPWRSPSRAAG